LVKEFEGKALGETLFIPKAMLKNDEEIFLDYISLEDLSQTLGVPVVPVANDGEELLEKLVGEAL
jgi:NifB/MoaA-like Fe-S oxidoreductase